MGDVTDLEILERVNSGLYGLVFKARQRALDRLVAVKVIKPEFAGQTNAVAHAKALVRVGPHPNIVTVFGVENVTINGHTMPAMVMEWLEGETFGTRLGGPRFSEQELRRICMGVLDGIDRMHTHGMHHGDLHFGNVILLSDSLPKIIDIDATKERSLGRLSDISKEGAKSADVDYGRQFMQKACAHSVLAPSAVNRLDDELQVATSLAELRTAVERLLNDPPPPGYVGRAASVALAYSSEEFFAKIPQFIEENKHASLHSLVLNESRRLRDELVGERFSVHVSNITPDSVRERVRQYEASAGSLIPALGLGCYWGNETHWNTWKQCIETAANCYEDLGASGRSGSSLLLELRQYGTFLLYHAGALGAFLNDQFGTLRQLVTSLEYRDNGGSRNLGDEMECWNRAQYEAWNQYIIGKEPRHYTPVSDHASAVLYQTFSTLEPVRTMFDVKFDRFEYFLGLMNVQTQLGKQPGHMDAPWGTFLWRRAMHEPDFGQYFVTDAETRGEAWPPFMAGLFERSNDVLQQTVSLYEEFINLLRGRLHIRMPVRR